MPLRPAACVAVLALAVPAAGCGSSNDAPSEATYSRNMSRVCAELQQQTNSVTPGTSNAPEAIASYADRLAKVLDQAVQSVANVERPHGEDGAKAKAYVDELRKEVDTQYKPALGELKQAAQRRDRAGEQAAAAKLRSVDTSKAKQLARAAGASGCAP